jgi:hypothetical protein
MENFDMVVYENQLNEMFEEKEAQDRRDALADRFPDETE